MSKYNIPENNSLKEEIEELLRLCEEAKEEYGEQSSYFEPGIAECEMIEWEEKTGIKIPESYKEWLRFSSRCQIRQTLAGFSFPRFAEIVPSDYIIIGWLIGDGEVLCFSKSNGNFVRYFEGSVNDEFSDFKDMLNEIIRMLTGRRKVSMEEKMQMLARLAEIRKRNGEV